MNKVSHGELLRIVDEFEKKYPDWYGYTIYEQDTTTYYLFRNREESFCLDNHVMKIPYSFYRD